MKKILGKKLIFSLFDYTEGIVYVRNIPDELQDKQDEDIANYFEELLHVHLDDCYYMIGNLQVDDDTTA